MNDWAILALASAGWMVALLEFIQLKMQRVILKAILAKLETIDVESTTTEMATKTREAMETLRDGIVTELQKLGPALSDAIKEYGSSIDTQAIIEAFSTDLVARLEAGVPDMVEVAAEQAKTEMTAMAGLDPETIQMMDEHPVGALICLATAAARGRAARQPPQPGVPQQTARRQI